MIESLQPLGLGRTDLEPKQKSLLDTFREHLLSNKDIVVVGELRQEQPWVEGRTFCVQYNRLFIAPKHSVFDIEKLNKLLKSSEIPGMTYSNQDNFSEEFLSEGGIKYGFVAYDEFIGEEEITHEAKISDAALATRIGIPTEKIVRKIELYKRARAKLYPDAGLAALLLEYQSGLKTGKVIPNDAFESLEFKVTNKQIEDLKRNQHPIQRLAGLITGK